MGKLKVIIVGGGISGLTLANCLQHADIDFVLLEGRENIGLHHGAGVGIEPSGARILDQLGVYADMANDEGEQRDFTWRGRDGKVLFEMAILRMLIVR